MKQAGTYIRKRPSMKDYDYGSEEDDFIVNCYRDFAAKNNDRWIPCRALLKTQNERFPNMKRNVSGLQSHTDRKQSLRTVRGFYK